MSTDRRRDLEAVGFTPQQAEMIAQREALVAAPRVQIAARRAREVAVAAKLALDLAEQAATVLRYGSSESTWETAVARLVDAAGALSEVFPGAVGVNGPTGYGYRIVGGRPE